MTFRNVLRFALAAAVAFGLALARPPAAAAQDAGEFFDPLVMQEIRLTLNTRDLRTIREKYGENTYYMADVQWRNVRIRNAGVRSRGNASRNPNKLSLRVDADRYVTGQRFLGLRSFVLKNMWQDGSFMHDALAMSFFARMGQPAPRQAFCRLYINNEFQGLYLIVESIDNRFLSRTLGENDGYLYSYQIQGPFHGEYLGDDIEPYKLRFEAQSHERETDAMLYLPIRDLFRELNEPDSAAWRERVEEYVDLPQFMTQVAIEAFLAEYDGLLGAFGMNNFFLYRMDDSKRHRFLPWDKDSSFFLPDYSIFQWANEYIPFTRAFEYRDLRDLFFRVLESAARSSEEKVSTDERESKDGPGWLEAEIDRIAALVAPSVEQDTRKSFTTEEFYESVAAMKDFARRRPGLVRRQIDEASRTLGRSVRE